MAIRESIEVRRGSQLNNLLPLTTFNLDLAISLNNISCHLPDLGRS